MKRGWLWFGLVPAACIAYQWFLHAAIVDAQTTSVRIVLGLLNGVPHAAINILLSAPSIALMFVAEYLYRIVRFPDHARVSIWKGIQLFVGHARGPRGTEARSQN